MLKTKAPKTGKRRMASYWVDCPDCGGSVENPVECSLLFHVTDAQAITGRCVDCGAQVKIPRVAS